MNLQPPKLLITGASGFTGQHACIHFLKAGFDVTGVTRKSSLNGIGINTEYYDLTDNEQVKQLIEKVNPQYLLHLAGKNHVGQTWIDPIYSLEANAMSTAYLLDAIRQKNPSCKIVVIGSALQFNPTVMSTLTNPYSLSKTLQILIAQSWAVLYNMHIVIAKPSNLIGPGLSNGVCSIFAKKIVDMEENKSERILEVKNAKAHRDFIDVRDAVSAYEILLMMGEPGEVYEIASEKSRSLEEIINMFKSLTTVDFEIKSKMNQIEQQVNIISDKLKKLGWKPAIPFESSLNDILNFYRSNKN
ncbi:NAD-dependent epimerase/dehydratase family protein [Metabacillus sediminilitoris]|uniref:NAD-dependent epimerase/dehydratase family protein n=1 Tax=Metabacillus sediminilitoris TaxID=2567941 RepID=A0A4S4BUX3_9BACI|nr:NAD-dependent epimerase/dehydratase family protein [Metabacillus sediminilitoris]QGQ44724.1 NAD-dependent epimerase/dehydratase family protein [Metabacillus sediminilitoris]THF78928.1 NAD-dependent epimerase/dehydratase family protein [Metabacillus sediminilitoris]